MNSQVAMKAITETGEQNLRKATELLEDVMHNLNGVASRMKAKDRAEVQNQLKVEDFEGHMHDATNAISTMRAILRNLPALVEFTT